MTVKPETRLQVFMVENRIVKLYIIYSYILTGRVIRGAPFSYPKDKRLVGFLEEGSVRVFCFNDLFYRCL